MLKLHTLKAKSGDCFVLEFGIEKSPKYILIDAGPGWVWEESLKPFLEKLGRGTEFELVVLSHHDDDHINALIDLVIDLRTSRKKPEKCLIEIKSFWHNSYEPSPETKEKVKSIIDSSKESENSNKKQKSTRSSHDGSECEENKELKDSFSELAKMHFKDPEEVTMRSFNQGDDLRDNVKKHKIKINKEFQGEFITADPPSPTVKIMGGSKDEPKIDLEIEIIGPLKKQLDEFAEKWVKWLEEHPERLVENRATRGAKKIVKDNSVPNLSSIMFLAKEPDGKSILFTGDGLGDHIIDGLKAKNLLKKGIIEVDVLKLPHHGSNRNITEEFFNTVFAEKYVISGDGRHGNPNCSTLEWIAKSAKAKGKQIQIYLTYNTNKTRGVKNFLDACPKDDYTYELISIPENEKCITIDLS